MVVGLVCAVVARSHRADDEVGSGCFDNFLGDQGQVVDLQDAFDLAEEADGETEVAVGDAGDGGDGFFKTKG